MSATWSDVPVQEKMLSVLSIVLRPALATWGPLVLGFVTLLSPAPAPAQTVVDASDRSFDTSERALLLSVLKRRLPDSASARVRSIVQTKPGVYCGEVSTKGSDGEYREFTRFVVETKIRQTTIAPTADPTRLTMILRMIEDRCRSSDNLLR